MTTHASNAWKALHDALPEDSRFRLTQLRGHIRFPGRLAPPQRTKAVGGRPTHAWANWRSA